MLSNEPQTIGGILDTGVRVYRQTLSSVIPPAAVFGVAMMILSLVTAGMIDYDAVAAGAYVPGVGLFVTSLVYGLVFLLFFLVVANRQWTLVQGGTPTFAADLSTGLALLLPTLFAAIAYYVVIVIGFILLVVPGLVVMVSMSLFLVVPIVERRGAWRSFIRSHQVVFGGNWWRTAAVLTVLTVVLMAISFLLQLVVGGTQGFQALMQPTEPGMLATIVNTAFTVFLYPLATAVMLVMFHDARLRKEGGDLESKLAALDET
ncbi:MAG: hypothetical protein ACU85V_09325 [Gammaproteobacteria bacterium]